MDATEHETLADLRQSFCRLPPPVIVFNKSHSGSRLLAALLEAAGIFIGSELNESRDTLSLLPLIRHAVERYYPDYGPLWGADASQHKALVELIEASFAGHLVGRGDRPWGWKLCETVYILPLLDYLFPAARFIHIIRDGRDVAFSNHIAPIEPLWQKIYVDAVGVGRWRGLWFGEAAKIGYRLGAPRYNIQHWVNSVTLGRRYGAMLRDRYLEVRYEDLCRGFEAEARRILAFAGVADPAPAIAALEASVSTAGIGKFRKRNALTVARITRHARPLLTALGYTD